MLTMCYQVLISGDNEQAGYSISNGYIPHQNSDSEDDFEGNGDCPSLSIEVKDRNGDDIFGRFYTDLTEPEFGSSEVELSAGTLGELKNAIQGKMSSWKLTNVRIEHGNIVLNLHNFGRKLWLKEKECELYKRTQDFKEGDALIKNTEPDGVWMYVKKTSYGIGEFRVNEYSKKGKLKRYYVIQYHRCREECKNGDRIAEIHEYSKKRLKRIIELFQTESEWNMLAEITEFKY